MNHRRGRPVSRPVPADVVSVAHGGEDDERLKLRQRWIQLKGGDADRDRRTCGENR